MHDARMLAVSHLYDDLENFAFCPAGREMCLYGDPAYPLRVHLQAPFRVGILIKQMEIFKESMSAVRACITAKCNNNAKCNTNRKCNTH